VVAPSGGAGGSRTLRRLNAPRRIEVRVGDSFPTALLREGTWLDAVEQLDRYRTDDRWWTERPVSRTYYELLLEDGRTATVFRDEIAGSWWEQRYQ
jgi:hypothetical protein